ncbi:MAG: dTDP-4-dehydrorhamnose 3,5-epimerase [Bacteroidota bacterium]
MFHKSETNIEGAFLIKPDVFGDQRGFFMELYNQNTFASIGLEELDFVQDNLSSSSKGTLRGMHFQAPPFAQGKLVTVLSGSVLDIIVDVRKDSPTYGEHYAIELNDENRWMVYAPPGMAHGFQVLSESCLFFYKCTATYSKVSEGSVAWDDPDLKLPWKDIPPILSQKDIESPKFKEFESPF